MIPVEQREASHEHWTLDKKVPVLIIATIVAQSIALGWWASSLDSRVSQLEGYVAEAKASNTRTANEERGRSDRLIRVETLMESIQQSVVNIERKVDQMTPVRPRN